MQVIIKLLEKKKKKERKDESTISFNHDLLLYKLWHHKNIKSSPRKIWQCYLQINLNTSNCGRLMSDIIAISGHNNLEGFFLMMDIEKAFG